MRLLVDWTRCDGHGLCARLLPELIGLDLQGFPVLGRTGGAVEVEAGLHDHARRTVEMCPRLALRLERDR